MKMGNNRFFPRPLWFGLALIVVIVAAYILVYQTAILPGIWSDIFLNAAIFLPAVAAAIFAYQVYHSFSHDDPPRRVWLYFSSGLIFWAIAEVVWFVEWLYVEEVPTPSWADVFWLLGFIPFALAFLFQYRLIYRTAWEVEARWLLGILVTIFIVTAAGTILLHQTAEGALMSWGQTYLEVFYAVGDAAMMVASIGLARLFGRGLWGRVWWGLLAFVISDALYSYVTLSGLYAFSLDEGNLLTLVVDSIYSLAYMLVALACWSQLRLVKYGPTLQPLSEPEAL